MHKREVGDFGRDSQAVSEAGPPRLPMSLNEQGSPRPRAHQNQPRIRTIAGSPSSFRIRQKEHGRPLGGNWRQAQDLHLVNRWCQRTRD